MGSKCGYKRIKELSSDIGKRLIDEGIKHAPDLYRLGISRINNFFL